MSSHQKFPFFDDLLPDLYLFILQLVEEYQSGKINIWEDIDKKVNTFFTFEKMEQIDAIIPHWHKMTSYGDGITLVHVMFVFMGLCTLPEFLIMTEYQQQLMKWIILFHDIEKEPHEGKRDYSHAFRSAAGAALALPKLGFPTTREYDQLINDWIKFTHSAITVPENLPDYVQDNRKLPQILDGNRRMFGNNTPAALIIKTILFHLSVDLEFWPPPAPLNDEEMERYFDRELIPLLKVMHLADGEGWQMFDPKKRERGRLDTLRVFERVERLIAKSF